MQKAPKHFIQIPVITARQKDISSTDKLVFGEIYTMLNTNDKCWLTNTGIGNRIAKNKVTVRNSVKKLRKLGYIKTSIVPNGHEHSKRYSYSYKLGGTKLGTTKLSNTNKSTSVVPNKVRQSYQIKYPSRSFSTSNSKSITNNKSATDKIISQLQYLGLVFNPWTTDTVKELTDSYGAKMMLKAIKIEALHQCQPRYLISNIESDLRRGCQTRQPKRHFNSNYRRSNNSDQSKRSAKELNKMEKPQKLHPTSKKMEAKLQRQLKELYRKK